MSHSSAPFAKKSIGRHSLRGTPCQDDNLSFCETDLDGVLEIHYSVRPDNRGHFCKPYERSAFAKQHLDWFFPSECMFSYSAPNVLRGMHYQSGCAKLVWIVGPGHVTDVALSVDRFSPLYGKFAVFDLYEGKALLISSGYAHGFCVRDDAPVCFSYLTDTAWDPSQEAGVHWDSFGLDWHVSNPIVSDKDSAMPVFGEHEW